MPFHFIFILLLHSSLAGNLGRLTWVRLQQPQEQRYPFLTVGVVFLCVWTKVCLPVLGFFNVHTGVNACDCTQGLYGHCKRVCCESWLWEKNPLPHQGIKPASPAWWSNALTNWATSLPHTFHTSVESLLKQWRMTGPWHHKLTSQSDALRGQLRPLCPHYQATSHNKVCNWLWPWQDWTQLLKVLHRATSCCVKNGLYTGVSHFAELSFSFVYSFSHMHCQQ